MALMIPKDPSTIVVNQLSPEANHKLHVLVAKLWKQILLKKANDQVSMKGGEQENGL
jgi:hypothetical protein